MKVKARERKGLVSVRVLIEHPMETGFRKDEKTGDFIPAKFIRQFDCLYQERTVFTVNFGRSVSKDPYLSFAFTGGRKGEPLTLKWIDNTGERDTVEVTIS